MKEYRLAFDSEFINPKALRDLCSLGEVDTVVMDNGKISIGQHTLRFVDESIEPGNEIIFKMNNWGIARIKSEVTEFNRLRDIRRKTEQEHAEQSKLAAIERAKAFHDSLHFPVKYHVGMKEVLSGLSANSAGNGYKQNTVIHLILDQDFQGGRMKRRAGDFFCTQSKSRSGADWSGTKNSPHSGLAPEPEVTCKKCLNLLSKFMEIETS
jgi:hypothetical protein